MWKKPGFAIICRFTLKLSLGKSALTQLLSPSPCSQTSSATQQTVQSECDPSGWNSFSRGSSSSCLAAIPPCFKWETIPGHPLGGRAGSAPSLSRVLCHSASLVWADSALESYTPSYSMPSAPWKRCLFFSALVSCPAQNKIKNPPLLLQVSLKGEWLEF